MSHDHDYKYIAEKCMQELTQQVTSAASYFDDSIDLKRADMKKWLEGKDRVKVTQKLVIFGYEEQEREKLQSFCQSVPLDLPDKVMNGRQFDSFFAEAAIGKLYQHTECGGQDALLMLMLMEKNIAYIARCMIAENIDDPNSLTHGFLLLKNKRGEPLVVDPYLRISCSSYEEYFGQAALKTYFRGKTFSVDDAVVCQYCVCDNESNNNLTLKGEFLKGYKPYVKKIKDYLDKLLQQYEAKFGEHVKEMKNKFQAMKNLDEKTFDIRVHGNMVKQSYLEKNERLAPNIWLKAAEEAQINKVFSLILPPEVPTTTASSATTTSSSSFYKANNQALIDECQKQLSKMEMDQEFYGALRAGNINLALRTAAFEENLENGFKAVQIVLAHTQKSNRDLDEIPSKNGKGVVHRAIQRKNWPLVELLVKEGADPSSRSKTGNNDYCANDFRDEWDTGLGCCRRLQKSCVII